MNYSSRAHLRLSLFRKAHVLSAKGAAFNAKAWGIAPGLMVSKDTSAESANHFQRD
jgi:hypothetical protein